MLSLSCYRYRYHISRQTFVLEIISGREVCVREKEKKVLTISSDGMLIGQTPPGPFSVSSRSQDV